MRNLLTSQSKLRPTREFEYKIKKLTLKAETNTNFRIGKQYEQLS